VKIKYNICVIIAYYFSGKMIVYYKFTNPYLKLMGADAFQNSKYFRF
jgi:hypothetical protein